MKQLYFKSIILAILTLKGLSTFAYDCIVDEIYYNLDNTAKTASVMRGDNKYSGAVTIPSAIVYDGTTYSVTSIGYSAFDACGGLTSITIPNSVTSIGDDAFEGCSGLTSVEIPSSVTSIGEFAFGWCYGMTSVVIPSGVTTIGGGAFFYCTSLSSVTIPNSVTSIGGSAFEGCSGLTSLSIGNSVTNIGERAFYGCGNLTSVIIPNSVTKIGNSAFYGCSGLTSANIGNGVTIIENLAFANSGLKTIVIEDGKETLSFTCISNTERTSRPFDQCPIETLYLGRNISYTSYNNYTIFSGKTTLTTVTIGNNVASIGKYEFYGCSGLTTVTIGNGVKSIGEQAFLGCTGLTSINIPSNLTSIGADAFSGCIGITAINLPNRMNSIGQNAFRDCSGLTTLSLPNSMTSIGDYAFYGCTNLESVYSEITDVFSIDAFGDGSENATLYVPYGKKLTYIQTDGWNVFKDIIEMDPALQNTSLLLSCNSKGSITINGTTVFTNKIGNVEILEDAENTIVFTPKANCKLEQVCFNGFDITTSVENNILKAVIPPKSQMVVMFSKQGDMNNDSKIDISDVVLLVNMILGQ